MRRILGVLAISTLAGLTACSDTTEPTIQTDETDFSELAGDSVAVSMHWGWGQSSKATVYVGHGINGTDLGAAEALPVDVSVNGACTLEGFEFRAFAGPLRLNAGDYTIAVSLANPDTPCGNEPVIGPVTVTLSRNDNVTIFAHLTDGGAPTASVFANEFGRFGRSQLAARHAANFGAVDVRVDADRRREIFVPGLNNGSQVSTSIRPGRHTVALEPAGTGTPVFETTLRLRPFKAYYAYAVGTPANGTFEVLLQTVRNSTLWSGLSRRGWDDDRD